MNRKNAFADLRSPDLRKRTAAARFIERHAVADDRAELQQLSLAETDDLVARILGRTLNVLEHADQAEAADELVDAELIQRERALAMRDAIAMCLHEVSPLIGHLEVVASQSVLPYAGSDVEAAIRDLQGSLDELEDFRTAADAPEAVEVNLTELVTDVVGAEIARAPGPVVMEASSGQEGSRITEHEEGHGTRVFLARTDPVVTFGAPRLLAMILRNVIRNALEACAKCLADRDARVVVSWGATDVDAWISVVDDCLGLPSLDVWTAGETTDATGTHRGMGLATVRRATDTIHGQASLSNGTSGGARFEVRWPVNDDAA